MKHIKHVLTVLIILTITSPTIYGYNRKYEDPNDKIILAHYMPWFSGDSSERAGGHEERRHWQDGYANNPLIGEYDSRDENVIEYHVLLAKSCGIDGFVINWYGQDSYEDTALKRFVDKLNRMNKKYPNLNFKFCISYDEQATDFGHYIDSDFVYLRKTYIENNNYLFVDSKPLLFIFPYYKGISALEYKEISDKHLPATLAWKESQQHEDVDSCYAWISPTDTTWTDETDWGWGYLKWFYKDMDAHRNSVKFSIGSVWPGFDDSRALWGKNRCMDRQNGLIYRWTWDLATERYYNNLPIKIILIQTWNDWNEGSTIEPSGKGDYHYKYIKITKEMARKCKKDLKDLSIYLPKKIYEKRLLYSKRDSKRAHMVTDLAISEFLQGNTDKAIGYLKTLRKTY